MKKINIWFISLLLSFATFSALAAPYHYVFSGSINYIEVDGVFLSDIDFDGDFTTPDDTFTVGEVVEYTFLVDMERPGFCTGPAGTSYSSTCTGTDIPDGAGFKYFYTELVSARKVAPPTEEDTVFNYGLSLSNAGTLVADSAVFVSSPFQMPVENWVATSDTMPGTTLVGFDRWAAPNGNSPYGIINSTLTLESITPVIVESPTKKCWRKHGRHHDSENDDGNYDKMHEASNKKHKYRKNHKRHYSKYSRFDNDYDEHDYDDEDSDEDDSSHEDDDGDHENEKDEHEGHHHASGKSYSQKRNFRQNYSHTKIEKKFNKRSNRKRKMKNKPKW